MFLTTPRLETLAVLLKSANLHWLRVTERITYYKLCVLVYNCLHGSVQRYLKWYTVVSRMVTFPGWFFPERRFRFPERLFVNGRPNVKLQLTLKSYRTTILRTVY